MTDEDYKQSAWYELKNPQVAAKRVVDQVRGLRKALNIFYMETRGWYPITPNGPIELGENGAVNLSRLRGFYDEPGNKRTYYPNIKSGFPTTKIIYDEPHHGLEYKIKFEIFAPYDGLEAGSYEAGPRGIKKVGDV